MMPGVTARAEDPFSWTSLGSLLSRPVDAYLIVLEQWSISSLHSLPLSMSEFIQ